METLQPAGAVVLVLVLLGAVLLALRKRGAASFRLPAQFSGMASRPRELEVVERATLGPQQTLHLVRVGERRILIATTPGSCQILDTGERL